MKTRMQVQKGNAEITVLIGLIVVVIPFLIAMLCFFCNWECESRWEGVFSTQWGPVQGCRIEVAPNKWIPEDRYREVAE